MLSQLETRRTGTEEDDERQLRYLSTSEQVDKQTKSRSTVDAGVLDPPPDSRDVADLAEGVDADAADATDGPSVDEGETGGRIKMEEVMDMELSDD